MASLVGANVLHFIFCSLVLLGTRLLPAKWTAAADALSVGVVVSVFVIRRLNGDCYFLLLLDY